MITYKFKFRRRLRLFYRTFVVVGHTYEDPTDRLILYLPDGGIHEISGWSICDCKLGPDWAIAKKKDMEAKAGQSIPVNGI